MIKICLRSRPTQTKLTRSGLSRLAAFHVPFS